MSTWVCTARGTSAVTPPSGVPQASARRAGSGNANSPPLRGATTCEAITDAEAQAVRDRLGPDPLRDLPGALDFDAFAEFLIRLHEAGIGFRALHLGNVLKTADGFALIDIGDCRFSSHTLSLRQRAKNHGGLCAHPTDAPRFGRGAWSELIISYARQAGFTLDEAAAMHHRVRAHVGRWDKRRTRQRSR